MKLIKKYLYGNRFTQFPDGTKVNLNIVPNLPIDNSIESKFYRDLAALSAMSDEERKAKEFYDKAHNTGTIAPTDVAARTGWMEINPLTGDVTNHAPTTVSAAPLTEGQRMWNSPAFQLALAPMFNTPFMLNNANKARQTMNAISKARKAYTAPKATINTVDGEILTGEVPVITAENAVSMTPEQWTAAQDAAISRGDWDEVYRLSDLHLRTKASEVGTPLTDDNGKLLRLYRGSQKDENVFTSWDPDNPTWTTTDKHYAINYTKPRMYNPDGTIRMLRSDPSKVKNLYGVYNKKVGPIEDMDNIKAWKAMYDDEFNTDLVFGHDYKVDHSKVTGFSDSNGIEYAFSRPTLLKSADPITYDNFGKRIGLGDRHNFSNPDIRWGLFPWLFGGTIGYNYLNKDNMSSKYTNGGKLTKRKL